MSLWNFCVNVNLFNKGWQRQKASHHSRHLPWSTEKKHWRPMTMRSHGLKGAKGTRGEIRCLLRATRPLLKNEEEAVKEVKMTSESEDKPAVSFQRSKCSAMERSHTFPLKYFLYHLQRKIDKCKPF